MRRSIAHICLVICVGCVLQRKPPEGETGDRAHKTVEQTKEEDEKYLSEEAHEYEVFRVFITRDRYEVRQVGGEGMLSLRSDPLGDKEQHKRYLKYHEDYDFQEWVFNGVLQVRINPHNGLIEHVEYVPGRTPQTWQASKLFQEDISRFRFTYPDDRVTLRKFHIRYRWRIQRREGLTDEEARARAIKFLQSQLR